jgi:predicted RNA-binding protein with TRAM domain
MIGMWDAVLVYLYKILGFFCNRGSRSSCCCCSCCSIEEVVRVGSCRWSRDGGYLVVVFGVMDGNRGIIKIKAMRKYTCIREKYSIKRNEEH